MARRSAPKLYAFAAVKEHFGSADGSNHFAFGALNLHPANMHPDGLLFQKANPAPWRLSERGLHRTGAWLGSDLSVRVRKVSATFQIRPLILSN